MDPDDFTLPSGNPYQVHAYTVEPSEPLTTDVPEDRLLSGEMKIIL